MLCIGLFNNIEERLKSTDIGIFCHETVKLLEILRISLIGNSNSLLLSWDRKLIFTRHYTQVLLHTYIPYFLRNFWGSCNYLTLQVRKFQACRNLFICSFISQIFMKYLLYITIVLGAWNTIVNKAKLNTLL